MVELALHGLWLFVDICPHGFLQVTGLGGGRNDALAAVPGVAFGGDQPAGLHSLQDFFVVDGRMLNSISMSRWVRSWDSPRKSMMDIWVPVSPYRAA